MVPLNRFGPNESVVRVDTDDRDSGMVPLKALFPMRKSVREMLNSARGNNPVNELEAMLSDVKLLMNIMSDERVPLKLLFSKLSVLIFVWFEKGRSPENEFLLRSTTFRLLFSKKDEGIGPNKLFCENETVSIAFNSATASDSCRLI